MWRFSPIRYTCFIPQPNSSPRLGPATESPIRGKARRGLPAHVAVAPTVCQWTEKKRETESASPPFPVFLGICASHLALLATLHYDGRRPLTSSTHLSRFPYSGVKPTTDKTPHVKAADSTADLASDNLPAPAAESPDPKVTAAGAKAEPPDRHRGWLPLAAHTKQQIPLLAVAGALAIFLSIVNNWLGPTYMQESAIQKLGDTLPDRSFMQLRVARARLLANKEAQAAAVLALAHYKWHHGDRAGAAKIYEEVLSEKSAPELLSNANIDLWTPRNRLKSYYTETNNVAGRLRLFELAQRNRYVLPCADLVPEMEEAASLYETVGNKAKAAQWRNAAEAGRVIPLTNLSEEDTVIPVPDNNFYPASDREDGYAADVWLTLGIERLYTEPNKAGICFIKALSSKTASPVQRSRAKIWFFISCVLTGDKTRAQRVLPATLKAERWLSANQAKAHHNRGVSLEEASFWTVYRRYLQGSSDAKEIANAANHDRAASSRASGTCLGLIDTRLDELDAQVIEDRDDTAE